MGRAPCCSKVGLKRGPWTVEEDTLLSKYIEKHGEGNWRILPKAAGLLRCGKSCRLRWINYLRPDVKRGNISEDEEELILKLHCLLGNRWSLIAGRIPGRTDNEIKNYWNSHLRKKHLATRKLLPLSLNTHYRCCSSDQKNNLHELQTDSQDDTNQSNLSSQNKHDPQKASHLCSTVSSESHGTDLLYVRSRSNNGGSVTSHSSALSSTSSISVADSLPATRPDQSCQLEPLDLPSIACMDCDVTLEYKSPPASFGCSSPSGQPYSEHPSSNTGENVLRFDYAADNIIAALFPAENEPNSLEQLQSLDFLQQEMEFDSLWDTSNWVAANFW